MLYIVCKFYYHQITHTHHTPGTGLWILAVISVVLAVVSLEALSADALVAVHPVQAGRPVLAGSRGAVVHVDLTVCAGVARPAVALETVDQVLPKLVSIN